MDGAIGGAVGGGESFDAGEGGEVEREDVELAGLRQRGSGRGGGLGRAKLGANFFGSGVAFFHGADGEGDVGSVASELESGDETDAAVGAGDDGVGAGEIGNVSGSEAGDGSGTHRTGWMIETRAMMQMRGVGRVSVTRIANSD